MTHPNTTTATAGRWLRTVPPPVDYSNNGTHNGTESGTPNGTTNGSANDTDNGANDEGPKEPYGPFVQARHGTAVQPVPSVADGAAVPIVQAQHGVAVLPLPPLAAGPAGSTDAVVDGQWGGVDDGPTTPSGGSRAALAGGTNAVAAGGDGTDHGTAAPARSSRSETELDQAARGQIIRARAWLPPIEPAVFDCYLGRLAERIDPHTQADPVGVLVSLLSAAGVHLGPGPHLQLAFGERHPLLVWPMLIGVTGIGQKGTATNAALSLLRQADPSFVANNQHTGLSSGEGLSAAFAVGTEDTGKAGGKPRLLPEGDCRLLTYEEEWGTVMARMRREGNTLGSLLRAAWQGGNLSTLNVDARMARRSHLGIIAHITPKEFNTKVSASDMAGGTYNRFLPIAVAQSKFHPPVPDGELMEHLAASLADRLHRAGGMDVIGFTEEAEWEWRRLHVEFSSHLGEDGPVAEFISRAGGNCVRIAAIYAVLDRSDRITPAHLAAAAALVRYSIASANAVLRPVRDEAARRLVAFITDAGPGGRTKAEITTGHFKNGGTPEDRAAVLDMVVADGRITVTSRPRADGKPGGRSAQIYVASTGRG